MPTDLDHRATKRISLVVHSNTTSTDSDDTAQLDHEMIRWLPLVAANDFLETHSDRDPAA